MSLKSTLCAAPAARQVAHATDTRSATAAAASARAPPVVIIATAPALFPCMVPVLVTRLGRNNGLHGAEDAILVGGLNDISNMQSIRHGL